MPEFRRVQPGSPQVPLFKYLSVSSGQSPTWHERLIQLLDGKCYLPSPVDFNDPFDSLPLICPPTSPVEFAEWKEALIGPMAEAIRQDIPAWFVQSEVRKALDGTDPEKIRELLLQSTKNFAAEIGVFCLAEAVDSVLMWSHYASNHTGFALEFDFSEAENHELLPLWKVYYTPERPVVSDIGSEEPKLHLAEALAVKADFWSYEGEWRVMRPNRARSISTFDPSVIKGVVFGAKCTEGVIENVQRLTRGSQLEFSRMLPDSNDFRLVRRPL